jgi:hypothetical protein
MRWKTQNVVPRDPMNEQSLRSVGATITRHRYDCGDLSYAG